MWLGFPAAHKAEVPKADEDAAAADNDEVPHSRAASHQLRNGSGLPLFTVRDLLAGLVESGQQLWRHLTLLTRFLAGLDCASRHHAVFDDGANQLAAASAFYEPDLNLVISLFQSLKVQSGQRRKRFKLRLTDFHVHRNRDLSQNSLLFWRSRHVQGLLL